MSKKPGNYLIKHTKWKEKENRECLDTHAKAANAASISHTQKQSSILRNIKLYFHMTAKNLFQIAGHLIEI